ncbi:MAG: rRNA maturation RNase YbeY [Terracidiphilus sp.]|jgi:probable rRNA maturation factor
MILIDPELNLGPSRRQARLSGLPVDSGGGRAPESKTDSPRTGWIRSALPWAERAPTPQTLKRFLALAQEIVGLSGQVTVLLTTDAAIRDLNRRFRHKNRPTDVLSFPSTNPAPGPEKIAGDVAISVETARLQAAEQGHALTSELKVLILHGVLHLAGYDHETDEGRMQRRERELRAELGLPLGLIERSAAPTLSRRTRKDGATKRVTSPDLPQEARKDGARVRGAARAIERARATQRRTP